MYDVVLVAKRIIEIEAESYKEAVKKAIERADELTENGDVRWEVDIVNERK